MTTRKAPAKAPVKNSPRKESLRNAQYARAKAMKGKSGKS